MYVISIPRVYFPMKIHCPLRLLDTDLHLQYQNESGNEILNAQLPTIKKYYWRIARDSWETAQQNSEIQKAPIKAAIKQPITAAHQTS